jgi:RND family efflux transporter MFP subunit
VNAGATLVSLDTGSLRAQLAQAQAGVDAAQANLDQLQAGPTPQAIQVSQAALATAEQTLANTYSSIGNVATDAYAKATDAVRNQVGLFYNNPDSNTPQLSFNVTDPQVSSNAGFQRAKAGIELTNWQNEINALSMVTPTSTLMQALQNATAHLSVIATMLNTDAAAVVNESGLSASVVATYKTNTVTAITEVNSAAGAINQIQQSIASEQSAIAQAQAQLAVTMAGATSQTIAAQQAQVAQAKANMQSIQVNINNASLVSPINGVVTVQNAKVGQTATAGQLVTSLISANNFEVDSYVPETDIGKVAVGNAVSMTFDAFHGETFPGKVFYIDPAQTIVSGVVDYLVKTSFNAPDTRIKSGLTANLSINTQTDQDALILPQYAVIQNASGTFVEVLKNGVATQIPVVLGIRDEDGNVEIASGVTEGEQVINIGLKAQ